MLPSGDERLTSAEPPDPERQFQVTSNIKLTLGEKVTINTYGLTGRLTGSLNARTDEQDVSRASGELNVAEGKYAAFGRNLDIERGRLLFNNGLVTDPGVDLRAHEGVPGHHRRRERARHAARAAHHVLFRAGDTAIADRVADPRRRLLESVQNSSRSGAARDDSSRRVARCSSSSSAAAWASRTSGSNPIAPTRRR